jgi:hypothetical protein
MSCSIYEMSRSWTAGEAGRRLGVIFGAGQVSRLFALTGVDHRREIADRPLLTLNSHDDPGVAA